MYIFFSSVAVLLHVPALCTLVGFNCLPFHGKLFFARVGAPNWPRDLCCILISAPVEWVHLCCDTARVSVHQHSVSRFVGTAELHNQEVESPLPLPNLYILSQ